MPLSSDFIASFEEVSGMSMDEANTRFVNASIKPSFNKTLGVCVRSSSGTGVTAQEKDRDNERILKKIARIF